MLILRRLARHGAISSMCAAVLLITAGLTVTASVASGHTARSGLRSASYTAIEKTAALSVQTRLRVAVTLTACSRY